MRRRRARQRAPTFRRGRRPRTGPTGRPRTTPTATGSARPRSQLFDRLLDRQFVGPAPGYAADVTAAIADQRPDLVVCSLFAFGAMVAAEAAGIPFDVLMPNIYLLPAPGMPPFGSGCKPATGPLGRLRDRAVTRAVTRACGTRACRASTPCAPSLGLAPLEHVLRPGPPRPTASWC